MALKLIYHETGLPCLKKTKMNYNRFLNASAKKSFGSLKNFRIFLRQTDALLLDTAAVPPPLHTRAVTLDSLRVESPSATC